MESVQFGSAASIMLASVVLPAPDAADRISMIPRRLRRASLITGLGRSLFNVLHLFPELIDRAFQPQADPGDVGRVGLRAQRIRFALKFLREKFKFSPDRLIF